jgi:hypothetical protein
MKKFDASHLPLSKSQLLRNLIILSYTKQKEFLNVAEYDCDDVLLLKNAL